MIFFMFRNRNMQTGFQRKLVLIFVVHSILLAGILFKEGIMYNKIRKGDLETVLGKRATLLGAAYNFWGALVGILVLLRYISPGFMEK